MSHNYYSEINLHITWHTKASLPLLTPTVEPLVHRYIKQRLINEKGVFIHEIGGIETHIHLVIAVPPTVQPSEWIGQLKGASAHEINQQVGHRDKTLQWQAGYGVVSFGTGDLEWVKEYVRNQRRHHAEGKTFDRLERFATTDDQQDARERA
ncbi:MAG: IS200/IS605 family transposase [Thermoguttaceae bacterium]